MLESKITNITIKIGDKKIELTAEEFEELKKIINNKEEKIYPCPYPYTDPYPKLFPIIRYYPYYPYYPYPPTFLTFPTFPTVTIYFSSESTEDHINYSTSTSKTNNSQTCSIS